VDLESIHILCDNLFYIAGEEPMTVETIPASRLAAPVTIRRAHPDDVAVCAQICYDAFYGINTQHSFPPDIPSPELADRILSSMFSHPGFYCVVAELDGQIVGSNCLDERSVISGVGPITIKPDIQNRGVGRKLMAAVLDRARERNAPGVRLVQAAFHGRSLSLYTNLGFDVREPLAVMQGEPLRISIEGCSVRHAEASDVEDCDRVCLQAHGHHRHGELIDALAQGNAMLVERNGRITGYTTGLGFLGHAVAESNFDLQALIASAESLLGPGILMPLRNAPLFRWCLEKGLRVVEPMTLMSLGLYNEPRGAYLPSISF
jgi:predicted N-acetyltransferase YhbS